MIKSKKRVETTYTLEFNEEYAEQLRLWLKWAFVVWQQCQYHPALIGEIFHGAEGTERAPKTFELNHDKALVILNRLDRPNEVEEV